MIKKYCAILSGNPFQYNMFLSNFHNWKHCIDTLHVCVDKDSFKCDLSKIYAELSSDIPVCFDTPKHISHGGSIRTVVERINENDILFLSHDDLLILNSNVIRGHLETIERGVHDAIFVRAGIGDPSDYINEFLFSTYPDIKEIFTKDSYLRNVTGVTTAYFMAKNARFLDTDRNFGQKIFAPSSQFGSWNIDRQVMFEVMDYALLQMYSQGFRNVFPYCSEERIIMYDVEEVNHLEKFLTSGMIHCTGSATTSRVVDGTVVWNIALPMLYFRRMFFHMLNSIMYFDFDRYPYMKDFACDVYIKHIKNAMLSVGVTDEASKFPYEKMSHLFKMRFYKENIELLK